MNKWKRSQVKHFNKIAKTYDNNKRDKYVQLLTDEIYDWVFNQRVLYMCCGTGNMLHHLNPKSVHGVDISPKMVEVAKQTFPQHTFEIGDAEQYTSNTKYDVCLLLDCLDHIENWQAAFDNAKNNADVVIVNTASKKWYPIFRILETLNLKMKEGNNRWIPPKDLENHIGEYEDKRSIRSGLSIFYRVGYEI